MTAALGCILVMVVAGEICLKIDVKWYSALVKPVFMPSAFGFSVLVRGVGRDGGNAPCVGKLVPLEDPYLDIGVADVHGKQHKPSHAHTRRRALGRKNIV